MIGKKRKIRGRTTTLCVMERTWGESDSIQGYQHFFLFPSMNWIQWKQNYFDQNWDFPGNDSGQSTMANGHIYQVNCIGRNILRYHDPHIMFFDSLVYEASSPFTNDSFRPVGIDYKDSIFYVLTGGEVAGQGSNIVENPGAEAGFPQLRDVYFFGRASGTRVTNYKHSGSYSVKWEGSGENGYHYYILGETEDGASAPFIVGETYDISVWVYIPSQSNFTVTLRAWDGNLSELDSTNTQGQWVQLSGVWTPEQPPPQYSCQIELVVPNGQNDNFIAYVDDWSATQQGGSSPSTRLLIFDPDFRFLDEIALDYSTYGEYCGITFAPSGNLMAATQSGHIVEFDKQGRTIRDKLIDSGYEFRGATIKDGYFVTSSVWDKSGDDVDTRVHILSYPDLIPLQVVDISSHLHAAGNQTYGTFFI